MSWRRSSGIRWVVAPNKRGGSRRWIVKAWEDSLRRLNTDYIDLHQIHRPDENTDLDQTLGALSDLVRDGKLRMVGSSTFQAETIVEAQWTAERRGHVRLRCEQPPYSIFVRGVERDVLATCERYGRAAIEATVSADDDIGWAATGHAMQVIQTSQDSQEFPARLPHRLHEQGREQRRHL